MANKRVFLSIFAFAVTAIMMFPRASYAAYPDHPIKLIVPFAAGGQTDSLARIISENLRIKLGKPVIVDNRAGGGGIIGTEAAAKAEPDGYTIVMVGPSTMVAQPLLNTSIRYKAADFVTVALISVTPMLVVVNSTSPYKTMQDLVAGARANDLSYGSSGVGSSMHLATEWLLNLTGTKAVHVPFRGSAQSLPALLANDINFLIDPPITSYPLVEGGQLRALAVTASTPDERLSALPTVANSVAPAFDLTIWSGLMAPKGTPKDLVNRLSSALREIIDDPSVQAQLQNAGVPGSYLDPEHFSDFLTKERDKYNQIIINSKTSISK